MQNLICDMNCFNCKFKDCVNNSDDLTSEERRQINRRDIEYRPKTPRSVYSRRAYYKDIEHTRQLERDRYKRNKTIALNRNHAYYKINREDILANKKSYYLENREDILKKRKENYVPHPRTLIDTAEAEKKRQREKERYLKNKDELSKKRKEKRLKQRKEKLYDKDYKDQQAVS